MSNLMKHNILFPLTKNTSTIWFDFGTYIKSVRVMVFVNWRKLGSLVSKAIIFALTAQLNQPSKQH